jgi:hypothetical protein
MLLSLMGYTLALEIGYNRRFVVFFEVSSHESGQSIIRAQCA